MHLAYLDDSQFESSLAMFGAVIMPHGAFGFAERVHSIAIEQLFTLDDIENFQEFHARDLFLGEGTFKGAPEDRRFDAITVLLQAMTHYDMPFIFSALDVNKLQKKEISRSLFETAPPSVAAFKMCLLGIESWAQNQHEQRDPKVRRIDYNDQYMVIVDETKDQELKKRLRNSYRLLREPRPYIGPNKNRLWHAHDAMFFCDSRDSIGIQIADLCTYFMQRHLSKRNPEHKDESEGFYQMFSHLIQCAKPEPEWSQYSDVFLSHV